MPNIVSVEDAVNSRNIPPGSRLYVSGNAATPQLLLKQLAADSSIRNIDFYGVLFLANEEVENQIAIHSLFSPAVCERITHRIIFNSLYTREAVNQGKAKYQLWHLSQVPDILRREVKPNVVFFQVSGPDGGSNYSLGTTVESVLPAIETAKENGGIVIAERNQKMPFVLGTTVPESSIDFIVNADYRLPLSPVTKPDEAATRIGEIIADLYIEDGSTLQYGIGEVPEAVTDAIIRKGVRDLGIHTELFADAMRKLVEKGIVTNKKDKKEGERFSVSSIFLAGSQEGYDWLDFNSSVQSRPSDYTNNLSVIARQPNMVSINSAIGIDLNGNIWADSLEAWQIYSGIGGQSDFIRGTLLGRGKAIIALKATTKDGISKIFDKHPEGITTTGIAADPIIIVTEHGAFNPIGLSVGEKAVGIAFLAGPTERRSQLLKRIYDHPAFHKPQEAISHGCPRGFIPYEK